MAGAFLRDVDVQNVSSKSSLFARMLQLPNLLFILCLGIFWLQFSGEFFLVIVLWGIFLVTVLWGICLVIVLWGIIWLQFCGIWWGVGCMGHSLVTVLWNFFCYSSAGIFGGKFWRPNLGKATAATRAALPSPTSACWVFLFLRRHGL